ncbi:hypothetical protein D3C79_766400 [compost metagenome]
MAHLTAHRVERQLGEGQQRGQLMAGGHHQGGCLPVAAIPAFNLPAIRVFVDGRDLGAIFQPQQSGGLGLSQRGAGQIRRAEPASQQIADPTVATGQAGGLLHLGGVEWAHQRGREGALAHLGELGGRFVVIAELHHATR